MDRERSERWNHNIHYHPVVLAAVPAGARTALDVGCGEGTLTRELARIVPRVVGLDRDAPSLDLARAGGDAGIEYVHGDVLTHDLAPESFDLVASIAALHHMDTAAGLRRMSELVRPGGSLAVIGLARAGSPVDLAFDVVGAVSTRLHELTKAYWEHSAPIVWPPPDTYRQTRRTATRLLPGARYRRHVLWRYSLVWSKPPR